MEEIFKTMLASAQSGKNRVGKVQLIRHLKGVRLTQREAIRAKCYDCNGMEHDECDIKTCSLYPYSPYGGARRSSSSTTAE